MPLFVDSCNCIGVPIPPVPGSTCGIGDTGLRMQVVPGEMHLLVAYCNRRPFYNSIRPQFHVWNCVNVNNTRRIPEHAPGICPSIPDEKQLKRAVLNSSE